MCVYYYYELFVQFTVVFFFLFVYNLIIDFYYKTFKCIQIMFCL